MNCNPRRKAPRQKIQTQEEKTRKKRINLKNWNKKNTQIDLIKYTKPIERAGQLYYAMRKEAVSDDVRAKLLKSLKEMKMNFLKLISFDDFWFKYSSHKYQNQVNFNIIAGCRRRSRSTVPSYLLLTDDFLMVWSGKGEPKIYILLHMREFKGRFT